MYFANRGPYNAKASEPDCKSLVRTDYPFTPSSLRSPLQSARGRKWLLFALKLAIVGLLVWGVRASLANGLDQLRDHTVRLEPTWLVASGLLYLCGMLPACLFWRRVLRVLGIKAGLLQTIRAYYIGHLGKYVPGKALVVLLREHGKRHGW